MKKVNLFIIVFLLLFIPIQCFASTKTFTRTKDNPLVPKDVVVNENNINDILKTPSVSAVERVYDYANLFTDEQEYDLYKKLYEYTDSTYIDSLVITTNDLKGFNIDQYAYNFYNYNDFKTEGVIFVIYIDSNRNANIFMGNSGEKTGKVFATYTDERIKQILEYLYKDIKKGNYYTATDNYITIIKGFADLNHSGDYRINSSGSIVKIIPWLEISVLSFALTFIAVVLLMYKLNGIGKFAYVQGVSKNVNSSTLKVKLESDELIDTTLTNKK